MKVTICMCTPDEEGYNECDIARNLRTLANKLEALGLSKVREVIDEENGNIIGTLTVTDEDP